MAQANDKEIVTFLDPQGREISNDPRWHAQRLLAQSGVDTGKTSADVQAELDAKDQEIEALRAALAAKQVEESLEDEDEATGDYSEVTGSDLVKLAKERGIDLKHEDGTKLKAGEVRAALAAQDAAK